MEINSIKTNGIRDKNITTFLDFMKLDGVPLVTADFLDWLIKQDFFIKYIRLPNCFIMKYDLVRLMVR